MVVVKEETRKGPWTEQEDLQLVLSVGLFGERHWDFIAQVSGLNRTGKSCRLRWVNYLHPGLKRGRMSPDEERLVLELHSRWGNRWSRIARRLPGRTDNEIKNYWRTHMRKRAQERKRSALSPLASPSSSSSSSSCEPLPAAASPGKPELHGGGEGCSSTPEAPRDDGCGEVVKGYPMEQIWNEIESKEMRAPACYREYCKDEAPCNISCAPMNSPPSWDYSWDSLWKMDDEEYKMFLPLGDFYPANQQHASES